MSSENILNHWLEEERQVRERLHPVGVITIAQLATYTGLEVLKKCLQVNCLQHLLLIP